MAGTTPGHNEAASDHILLKNHTTGTPQTSSAIMISSSRPASCRTDNSFSVFWRMAKYIPHSMAPVIATMAKPTKSIREGGTIKSRTAVTLTTTARINSAVATAFFHLGAVETAVVEDVLITSCSRATRRAWRIEALLPISAEAALRCATRISARNRDPVAAQASAQTTPASTQIKEKDPVLTLELHLPDLAGNSRKRPSK